MKVTFTLVCLLLTLSTVYGQEALRQKSNTKGLNIGLSGQYAFWNIVDNPGFREVAQINPGFGLGVRLGYGFSQRVEAALSADVSILSHTNPNYYRFSMTLSHLDLTGRLNIGSTTSRFRPFIGAGVTMISSTAGPYAAGTGANAYEVNLIMNGTGLAAGAGINYFFGVPLAVSARYMGSFGQFTNNRLSNGTDLTKTAINTHRASLGLTWFVRGRR